MKPGQDYIKFQAYMKVSNDPFQTQWGWSNESTEVWLKREHVKAWAIPSSVSNWPEEMNCKWDHFASLGWHMTDANAAELDSWEAGICDSVHVAGLNGDYQHASHAIYLLGDLDSKSRLGPNTYFTEVWYRMEEILP